MNLSIGIIGLPNAGKSTLFNALVKGYRAKVAEHPFTTIEPNIGIVEVPDDYLTLIAKRLTLNKTIPATIEFIDIAGLVKGAHKGEGLGNQFLSHIGSVDAILHLVNYFDENADPQSDIETIKTELLLKDFQNVEKSLKEKDLPSKIKKSLEKFLKNPAPDPELAKYNLLSQKPVLYVANIAEENLNAKPYPLNAVPICAKLESDLLSLTHDEQEQYLRDIGEYQPGLEKIIKASYKLLNLITFYTLLPDQVQAWPIQKGKTALEAAAKIHTDFARRFIITEVISAQDLLKFSSWHQAHEKGKVRAEGKEYLISNADVVYFKHG